MHTISFDCPDTEEEMWTREGRQRIAAPILELLDQVRADDAMLKEKDYFYKGNNAASMLTFLFTLAQTKEMGEVFDTFLPLTMAASSAEGPPSREERLHVIAMIAAAIEEWVRRPDRCGICNAILKDTKRAVHRYFTLEGRKHACQDVDCVRKAIDLSVTEDQYEKLQVQRKAGGAS